MGSTWFQQVNLIDGLLAQHQSTQWKPNSIIEQEYVSPTAQRIGIAERALTLVERACKGYVIMSIEFRNTVQRATNELTLPGMIGYSVGLREVVRTTRQVSPSALVS